MRRKTAYVKNGRRKALLYTCSAIALSVYGIPKLPRLAHGMAGTFTLVWLLFLALSLGANLYFLFGTDKERARLLEDQGYEDSDVQLSHERAGMRG